MIVGIDLARGPDETVIQPELSVHVALRGSLTAYTFSMGDTHVRDVYDKRWLPNISEEQFHKIICLKAALKFTHPLDHRSPITQSVATAFEKLLNQ